MNNLKKIEEYLDKDIPYIDRNSSYKMIEIYRKDLEKYETITKFPMWIGFKVTSKCNFKCIHCWVQRRENEPSFEEIIVALDKLKKMSVMHITITGGEPFLRKRLRYVKSKHLLRNTNVFGVL